MHMQMVTPQEGLQHLLGQVSFSIFSIRSQNKGLQDNNMTRELSTLSSLDSQMLIRKHLWGIVFFSHFVLFSL